MKRSLLILLCLTAIPLSGQLTAQRISLSGIDPADFPRVRANLFFPDSAADSGGERSADDLTLLENGIDRPVILLDCPPSGPAEPISSVLTVDVSGSMGERTWANLRIARAAATAWINALPLGISEAAISSFSDDAMLIQDFTIDRDKLLAAVDSLRPIGGTSYDDAFLAPGNGALDIASAGRNRRIIVFLTDGKGGGDEDEIVRRALEDSITIYCVTVGFPAPDILKNLAVRTGGLWFENVEDEEEAAEIYRSILGSALGATPCRVEWISGPGCVLRRDVELTVRDLADVATGFYQAPPTALATLEADRTTVRFGPVDPGSSAEQTIRISVPDAPTTVREVTSSNPHFQIVAGGAPPAYSLTSGSGADLVVRYSPTSREYEFGEILVRSDGCLLRISVAGGVWGGGDATDSLLLLYPNGGERFLAGTRSEIVWTGAEPGEAVRVEYSTDAGATWTTLSTTATDGRHPWIVPGTPSERCLARVSVDGPSGSGLEVTPVTWFRGHSAAVNVVRFTPDGTAVASGADDRTVQIWDPFSGALQRTLNHSTGVFDLDFDRTGRYLISANRDEAIVWNRALETRELTITEPGLSAVAFSQHADTLISTATNVAPPAVKVWDAFTPRDPLHEFASPIGRVFSLDMPTGANELLIAGEASAFVATNFRGDRLWRYPDEFQPGHTASVVSARFGASGTRIASAGNDMAARVWGRTTRTYDSEMRPAANDADLSDDGTMLIAGVELGDPNVGYPARVFDAASGALIAVLDVHTGPVTSVDISSDGRYAVTASRDSSVIVWELRRNNVRTASDRSDSLWAIIDYDVRLTDVDFGNVLVGSSVDSVVTVLLRNTGTAPVLIEGLSLVSGDVSSFETVSFVPGDDVLPGESTSVELRFAPLRSGLHAATLQIEMRHTTGMVSLTGVGVEPTLALVTPFVDFGVRDLGSQVDSLISAAVTNIGTAPVVLRDAVLAGPDYSSFQRLSGPSPVTLLPGDTASVELRFEPVATGRRSGSILFMHDAPGAALRMALFGEGVCVATVERAEASIAPLTGAPGDTLLLDVRFRDLSTSLAGGATTVPLPFTIAVEYHPGILYPLSANSREWRDDTTSIVTWSGIWNPGGEISWNGAPPSFFAALGPDVKSRLAIHDVKFETGCEPDLHLVAGGMTLVDLCEEGEIRLFDDRVGLKLSPPSPNPASGEVTLVLELLEDGLTHIELIAADGTLVTTVLSANVSAGPLQISFSLEGVPSGHYRVVVSTPTQQRSLPLQVIH